VRDRAPLSRPEDPRDRRGHERGAAHGHRQAPRSLGPFADPSPSHFRHGYVTVAATVPGVGRHNLRVLPIVFAAIAALFFAQALVRLRRRGRADLAGWGRVALFAAGLGVTLFALAGPP